jgi:hypothetical protein
MTRLGGKETMRSKTQRSELFSVMYSYVGTDAQFDEFLKMMIHDYLAVDHPYTKFEPQAVGFVESGRD